MKQVIYCGTNKIPIRDIPGFSEIGMAYVTSWRIVSRADLQVIGPCFESLSMLLAYCENNYIGQWS